MISVAPVPFVVTLLALASVHPAAGGSDDRGRANSGVKTVAVAEAIPLNAATALKLDGELTDEVWDRAPRIDGFVQREPKEGAAPSYATEARIAYDSENIYVAVVAHDPQPDGIVGHLTRRDTQSPSDWIRVAIDSYYDKRTAYEFAVNPAGVKQDKYFFNDGNEDQGWDAVWDVGVSKSAEGWRAEFRIPLSQLRFPRADHPTFGLAITRQIGRLNETSTWPLIAKSVNGFVSQFGELRGLQLTQSPKRLELVPYTVAELKTEPENDNPLVDPMNPGASAGLDMKYAITPALTLTATVNPDFGQVEADPAVVNLTAFETFFPERRPFFVEGSGIFRFDMDCNDGACTGLFYTRRIGRPPQIEPEEPENGYISSPVNTTIIGATKVAGRVGGFSVGILNAVTADEEAQVAIGPLRSTTPIEPTTSYTVGRARREFRNQSSIGLMLTATNRALGDDLNPTRVLGQAAYTGGVDWDLRFRKSFYSVAGYLAGSHISGTEAAIARLQENNVHSFQRPDADHVEFDPSRTTLAGGAGFLAFRKISGERVRFESNIGFKSPGFDANDLGFIRRADTINQSNWIQWRHDRPGKYIRSYRINFNQWSGHNFDGDRLFFGGNVNMHWTWQNNWANGFGINHETDAFDDRATRGGPGARYEGIWSIWSYLDTDNRKPLSFGTFAGAGRSDFGPHWLDVEPYGTYRPMSSLSLTGGIRFSNFDRDAQWVENIDAADSPDGLPHYIFARLDQQTVAFTTRVNYTMTPNLSLQVYAEPFVSAGAYTGYMELVDGRADDWRNRYAPYPYTDNADFNYRSFRMTNVLRWEYKPGSALFVVWQQGREETETFGDYRFGRDFRGVFGIPASNVFLVKLSYWLNY
jgi:Domain of unknown function (DUF5916)/Carbohydrate family 9 binding domain-like